MSSNKEKKFLLKLLNNDTKSSGEGYLSGLDLNPVTEESKDVGKIWTDKNGITWEQRNGYKVQKGKVLEALKKVGLDNIDNCPKCSRALRSVADKKIFKMDGHCLECQIEIEAEHQLKGTLKQYYIEKITKNALAWIKVAEEETLSIVDNLKAGYYIVDEQGNQEKWNTGKDVEGMADKIWEAWLEMKNDILKQIEENGATASI